MALLTGKTAELVDVSYIPGVMDARGSCRYSWFVPFLWKRHGNMYVWEYGWFINYITLVLFIPQPGM